MRGERRLRSDSRPRRSRKGVELTVVNQHLLRPEIYHSVEVDGSESRGDSQIEEAEEEGPAKKEVSSRALFVASSSRTLFRLEGFTDHDLHIHGLLRNRSHSDRSFFVGAHSGSETKERRTRKTRSARRRRKIREVELLTTSKPACHHCATGYIHPLRARTRS